MTGFIPVRRGSNTPYVGSVNRYFVSSGDGTALYVGDPVCLAGSADSLGHYPSVIKATYAAGNQWLGIVVGVLPVTNELKAAEPLKVPYRAGSTNAYVLVCDDPDQEYVIGEDGAGAVLVIGDVGNLGIAVAGTASTAYSRSGALLDSSSFPSGTATGQLKLLGLVDRPDLVLGTGTTPGGALWRVKINGAMHELVTPGTTEP